jgi:hypothetical protein
MVKSILLKFEDLRDLNVKKKKIGQTTKHNNFLRNKLMISKM